MRPWHEEDDRAISGIHLNNKLERLDRFFHEHPRRVHAILGCCLSLYILGTIYISIQLYSQCRMINSYDLSIFSQSMWNTLQGRFFENSVEAWMIKQIKISHFAFHNQPILFLFLPFYAVFKSPVVLMILQCAIFPLGALGIYHLAASSLRSFLLGFLLFLFYLFHPVFLFNILDFHPESLVLCLIPWIVYTIEKKKLNLCVALVFLMLTCKENTSLTGMMLGLYIFGTAKSIKYSAMVTVSSLAWFILSIHVVMPFFSGSHYFYIHRFSQFGNNFLEIAGNILIHPQILLSHVWTAQKGAYMIKLLLPFGFMPVLSPLVAAIALAEIAQNLLSNMDVDLFLFGRTSCIILAVFTCATVFTFKKLQKTQVINKLVLIAVGVLMLFYVSCFYGRESTLNILHNALEKDDLMMLDIQEVKTLVKGEDSMSVDYELLYLFSNREYLFSFPGNSLSADKVLVMKRFFDHSPDGAYGQRVKQVMETGWYHVLYDGHRVLLFEHNASGSKS